MESLHLSFQNIVNAGMFKGVTLDNSLQLSHLFYVDDVIFLGKWCDSNIKTIIRVLDCFFRASGLRINLHKSKIMGIVVENSKVDLAAADIGCMTLKSPFSYLCVKVGGRMMCTNSWEEIINKLLSRLSKWKMKTLLIGGRLTLLKSVLGSMPIYYMSMFEVPKQEKGGLGVSSFYALNRALIFKWIWRFRTQSSSLWARVIKVIHGMDGKIGCSPTASFSSNWIDIPWKDDVPLKSLFPRIYALESIKSITVAAKTSQPCLDSSLRRMLRKPLALLQFMAKLQLVGGEIVNGSDTTSPLREYANGSLKKWKVRAGKALIILKTTIEDEKNDSKLQLLENEPLSVSQRGLTIPQYFYKIKTLCREIGELDPQSKIGEARMKRIIIHGLKQDYESFVATVQGWPTRPSLAEFENLLASREALAKQLGDMSINSTSKTDAEALYADNKYKGKTWYKGFSNKSNRPKKSEVWSKRGDESEKGETINNGNRDTKPKKYGKRFPYNCHSCGRRVHMAKDCRLQQLDQGNSATVREEKEWDVHALAAHTEYKIKKEGDFDLTVTTINKYTNYLNDWIIDSATQIEAIRCLPRSRNEENLLSVPQLTAEEKYVLFGPEEVYVFKELQTLSVPILKGHKNESVYVLSAEHAFVEKTKDTQNADLWHHRLGHVGYDKLELMMKRGLVTGLPKLEVRRDIVCAGCQYGKTHQELFHSSSYRARAPLDLVHSDVWGPAKHASIKGLRYAVTFIDDYSRFTWIYFVKEKSEVLAKFKEFVAEAERYDPERKGWRCIEPSSRRIHISRNVVFDEMSSWWGPKNEPLQDSQKLTKNVGLSITKLNPTEEMTEAASNEEQVASTQHEQRVFDSEPVPELVL
ncbi:putative RNA-directed DNA polymerase [Tanacetum coccineum]